MKKISNTQFKNLNIRVFEALRRRRPGKVAVMKY